MAAITWSTLITDFLATKGVDSTEAGYINTFITRLTALNPEVTKSSTLIKMLEAWTRPILEVAKATYGAASAATIVAYVKASRPDLYAVADTIGDIIYTDIDTNLIPAASIPTIAGRAAVDVRNQMIAGLLEGVIHYMRHFSDVPITGTMTSYDGEGTDSYRQVEGPCPEITSP